MDQNQQRQQELEETLTRAGDFESLVNQGGWKYILAYYQNMVQAFTNELLISDKPIAEFESRRHELMGIRKLLGYIQDDIDSLNDYRKKDHEGTERPAKDG